MLNVCESVDVVEKLRLVRPRSSFGVVESCYTARKRVVIAL